MGYESLEEDSLITIKHALRFAIHYMKSIGIANEQILKDMRYEIGRVDILDKEE